MVSPSLLNAGPFWQNPFEGLNSSNEDSMPLSNLNQSPSLGRLLDDFLKPSVATFESTQNQGQIQRLHSRDSMMRLASSKYAMMPSQMHLFSDKYSGANLTHQMALQTNTGSSMFVDQSSVSQYPTVMSGIRMSDIYAEPMMISPEPHTVNQIEQKEIPMPISPPHDLSPSESAFQVVQEPFELKVLPVRPPVQQHQGQSSCSTFVRQRRQSSGSFSSCGHHWYVSEASSARSRRGSTESNVSSEGTKTSGGGSITKMSQLYALHDVGERKFDCPRCPKKYRNMNGLKYHLIHVHSALEGITLEVLLADRKRSQALKPFDCPIGGCLKRYKNPNGLKYHLDHAHTAEDLINDPQQPGVFFPGQRPTHSRAVSLPTLTHPQSPLPVHSRAVSLSVIELGRLSCLSEDPASPVDETVGTEDFLFSPQLDMSQNLLHGTSNISSLPLSGGPGNGFQI